MVHGVLTWEIIVIFDYFQWFSLWSAPQLSYYLNIELKFSVPPNTSTKVFLVVSSAITSHWSFMDLYSSLALIETFLLSASTVAVCSWRGEMPFLSQHWPGSLCYYRKLHDITFYLNHSLLRSLLLETLALVQWQRWPNVPLSSITLYAGFFLA